MPVWEEVLLSLFTGFSLAAIGAAMAFKPHWMLLPAALTLLGIWLLNVLR